MDLSAGSGAQNSNGDEVVLVDVVAVVAYRLEECLEACSLYTAISAIWNHTDSCESITFGTNMDDNLQR